MVYGIKRILNGDCDKSLMGFHKYLGILCELLASIWTSTVYKMNVVQSQIYGRPGWLHKIEYVLLIPDY